MRSSKEALLMTGGAGVLGWDVVMLLDGFLGVLQDVVAMFLLDDHVFQNDLMLLHQFVL